MDTKNPLVSVFISAYNHEMFVEETINSIIAQTYKNIELIVIDDGSKDKTWEKICSLRDKCFRRFPNIIFETQENQGVCKTLNKMIDLASGKYVYIIASDDVAKPQTIEAEVNFLENNPEYVLVVGDNEIIDTNSNRVGWDENQRIIPLDVCKYKTFGAYLQDLYKDIDFHSATFGAYENFVKCNYIPNGFLFPLQELRKIGGYKEEAPLEDWYLHLQLSKVGKMKYMDEILGSYRWHDNNTIKRTEYMNKIAYDTLCYEKKLTAEMKNQKWYNIFMKAYSKTKMKFNFLNIIKYYTCRNADAKQYVLEILGHRMVIRNKYSKNYLNRHNDKKKV